MLGQTLSHTYKRYRTLQTQTIKALPIVILMPHSACNCRCVMCDIWKGNHNLHQLTETDVRSILETLKKFETRLVLMSGGEALLNTLFFNFCEILRKENIKINLLSTGITLKKNAAKIVDHVNEIIVSLDGDELTHNRIRNINDAFSKLREGITEIKSINPDYRITGRSVIHQLNFMKWPAIIEAAKDLRLDQISFLPADVSSHAFNRDILWDINRQHEILPSFEQIAELKSVIEQFLKDYKKELQNGFIAESPSKIWKIYEYYAACYGLNSFPVKRCNAPSVSTVIEADGTVRPCFFHQPFGNIRNLPLDKIVNSDAAVAFRKQLDIDADETCSRCVCHLNLSPRSVV